MQNICFLIISTFVLLAGCGGGAATGSSEATTYKVILETQGILSTGALSGIGVTLQLPTGVIPKIAADGSVESSVVKASGVLANNASLLPPSYTPPSGSSKGTLSFVIASTSVDGFGIGEFATVTLDISGLNLDFATVNQNIANGTMLPVASMMSASTVDLASYAVVDTISIKISAAAL